jgi:rhodanese-related sulfurtransferase
MTTATSSEPRSATEAHPTTVREWVAGGRAIIVDVREPAEHRAEHIPGSRLVPLSRFEPAQVPREEGKTVVLHCKSGRRSATALQRLQAAGRADVVHMEGGIEAWKAAGGQTVRGASAPIDVMRQTQIVIGTFVLAGVLLGVLVSPWFLILSGFMGAGLIFAGASGWCGMAMLIARMPWNR